MRRTSFRYALTDTGRFKLWSCGSDREDDGGWVALDAGKDRMDKKRGDSVWGYTPSDIFPPEAQ